MRKVGLAGVIWLTGLALLLACCSEEPIGQPCTFSWPKIESEEGFKQDCSTYPTCAPLQDTSEKSCDSSDDCAIGQDCIDARCTIGVEPANDSCPMDCIQIPSLECTNLICVATQVEEGSGEYAKEQLMNGQCTTEIVEEGKGCEDEDDPTVKATFGCMGYCTKECISAASCPKGYRCTQMAPFGENLRCDNEDEWGDGGGDDSKKCTDACRPTGTDLGDGKKCPSSVEGDPDFDYSLCDVMEYRSCCACMCYRFCPLLTKKFCRRIDWDQKRFPEGVIETTEGPEGDPTCLDRRDNDCDGMTDAADQDCGAA